MAWGVCDEETTARDYWPWSQVFRSLTEPLSPEQVANEIGPLGAELGLLAPELRSILPGLSRPLPLQPEQGRFRMMEAVAAWLRRSCAEAPALLVFDDIHDGDPQSLMLLRSVSHCLVDTRAVIVATLRDHSLAAARDGETITDTLRHGKVLHLQRLTSLDVQHMAQHVLGRPPSPELIAGLEETAEGNPFIVEELLRRYRGGGGANAVASVRASTLEVPGSVSSAIYGRLSLLGEESRRLLRIAAVLGRRFALDGLAAIDNSDACLLRPALEEACSLGIVSEGPTEGGELVFCHSLFREALYDELDDELRRRLHQRAGEALEEEKTEAFERDESDIAGHFLKALPSASPAKALDYAVRVAERAFSLHAHENAAAWYMRALAASSVLDSDPVRQCALLMGLGEAERCKGNVQKSRRTFFEAVALARHLLDPETLARAVLGYGSTFVEDGNVSWELVSLLEESLDALGGRDSLLRARVLSRLAVALYFSPRHDRAEPLSTMAVEMAERLGDDESSAAVWAERQSVIWGPGRIPLRLKASEIAERAALRAGRQDTVLGVRLWTISALLEQGRVDDADRAMRRYAQVAEELHLPVYVWHSRLLSATRALMQGRFEEAESLALAAVSAPQGEKALTALQFYGVQSFSIRREQGRLDELEPSLNAFLEEYPGLPIWRCGLSLLYCELGRRAEAQRDFERLAAAEFKHIPKDGNWLAAMTLLAEVCVFLEDVPRATLLYELLIPFADLNAVVGCGAASYGSVAVYLGMLAGVCGRFDEAASQFRNGREQNAAMGAAPLVIRADHAHARMLVSSGSRSDAKLARDILARVKAGAGEFSMKTVASSAAALLESVSRQERLPVRARDREPATPLRERPVFKRSGEFWSIGYQGDLTRLKDCKGLAYIAALLGRPGESIHAMALVSLRTPTVSPLATGVAADLDYRVSLGDAGGEYRRSCYYVVSRPHT